jgi:uncharacterized protein
MKFITDGMLGKVGRWLRFLGYDTLYMNSRGGKNLLNIARKENREILTKNKNIVERNSDIAVYVEGENTFQQLKKLKGKLNLKIDGQKFFTICSVCNTYLVRIEKEKIKDAVPRYVYENQKEFKQCPCCKRIYWNGDHYKKIIKILSDINGER